MFWNNNKNLVRIYNQSKLINKMYKYFWDKYDGDNKETCYDKIKIHRMCKKDIEFEIEKINFLKENSISYKCFEEHMTMYEKALFDELFYTMHNESIKIDEDGEDV